VPILFGSQRLAPQPGQVGKLGKLLEITFIDPAGRFRVQRFDEPGLPDLLWNDDLRALFAYPAMDPSTHCIPLEHVDARAANRYSGFRNRGRVPDHLSDGVEIVERWHQRPARCYEVIDPPDEVVTVIGMADTVVYRSDKWEPHGEPTWNEAGKFNDHPDLEGSQEYVHQYDIGVVLEESTGYPPETVVMHGGKLEAWKEGLVY
jgi:hypothetical protein